MLYMCVDFLTKFAPICWYWRIIKGKVQRKVVFGSLGDPEFLFWVSSREGLGTPALD